MVHARFWVDYGPLGSYPAAPITCCFRWTCQCANSNCLTKGFTPPVRECLVLRPFHKAHFAGKELQSGKKMERAIQPEIPLPDSGTHERGWAANAVQFLVLTGT